MSRICFNRKDAGDGAEERACDFLSSNGFLILRRNYRFGRVGEIDIIAKGGGIVVFVEVRSRSGMSFGGALASVSASKIGKIKKTAEAYLRANPDVSLCRFDLIAIDNGKLEWIQDIIR